MSKFIFDVDGTLTPSRSEINPEFKEWFLDFCSKHQVFLVTGSDRSKTIEQIGEEVYNAARKVYNCSGADVWVKDENVKTSEWRPSRTILQWLREELVRSPYMERTGNHIELRPGCLNFSIVGRNANTEERAKYVKYDKLNNERRNIAATFNYIFAESDAQVCAKVGGDTGLDIYPIGGDKSQILTDFNESDNIHFYGDAMFEGGNDKPLANALKLRQLGFSHEVKGWEDTWEKLRKISQ